MEILRRYPNCDPDAMAGFLRRQGFEVMVRAPFRNEVLNVIEGRVIPPSGEPTGPVMGKCIDERIEEMGYSVPGGIHVAVLAGTEPGQPVTVRSYESTLQKLKARGILATVHDFCGMENAVETQLLRELGIVTQAYHEVKEWIAEHTALGEIKRIRVKKKPHNANGLLFNTIEGTAVHSNGEYLNYDDHVLRDLGADSVFRLPLIAKICDLVIPQKRRIEILA